MLKKIFGKKIGMTQIFTENGVRIPVTVLEVSPLHVLRVLKETKGKGHAVNAIEVGYDVVREVKAELQEMFKEEFALHKALRVKKPVLGVIKKAGFEKKFALIRQIKVEKPEEFNAGDVLTLEQFQLVKKVDVQGTTKGRGFTGPIKRHNLHTGPNTHGSRYHRGQGSLGPSADPSRVYPGKKLAGHYGNEIATVRNLDVVKVDLENNLLVVKGAVPGANGGYVVIKTSL